MIQRSDVQVGMAVYCCEGTKVGRVQAVSDEGFTVEKGFFRVRDYFFRFADVVFVKGVDVHLALTRDELERTHREGAVAAAARPANQQSTSPTDFAESRMDSAEHQEHERYVTAPTGEGPHGEVEGPRRRASGPGWDALSDEETGADTTRR